MPHYSRILSASRLSPKLHNLINPHNFGRHSGECEYLVQFSISFNINILCNGADLGYKGEGRGKGDGCINVSPLVLCNDIRSLTTLTFFNSLFSLV